MANHFITGEQIEPGWLILERERQSECVYCEPEEDSEDVEKEEE